MNINNVLSMAKESESFSDFMVRCLISELIKGDDGLERGVVSLNFDSILDSKLQSFRGVLGSSFYSTVDSFFNKTETNKTIAESYVIGSRVITVHEHIRNLMISELTSGSFGEFKPIESSRKVINGVDVYSYSGDNNAVFESYRQYIISLLSPFANITKFDREFQNVKIQNEKREQLVSQLEQRVAEFDESIEREVSKFEKIKIESTSILKNLDNSFEDVSKEIVELKKKLLSDLNKSVEMNNEAQATIDRLTKEIEAEQTRLEEEKKKTLDSMSRAELLRQENEASNKKLKIASAFVAVGALFI